MNKYSITVTNNSGNQQKYVIFNKAPVVTGKVQPKIWHNVFAVANTPDGNTGRFTMYKQYYAIVGSSEGAPADGVTVNISGVKPATLGSTADDGTIVKGKSFNMIVRDEAPQFTKADLDANGYVMPSKLGGPIDADNVGDTYMIGLGGSKTGNTDNGPSATFIPEPNVHYQIQPANTYFLAFGNYTKRNIIDVPKIGGQVLEIDFTKFTSRDISVNHTDKGKLVIQM